MNAPSPGSPTIWTRSFKFVCLATLLAYTHQFLLLPILPLYVTDFGGSILLAGLIVSAFSVTSFFLRPLAGFAADRWNGGVVLFAGCLTLAASGLAMAVPVLPLAFVANAVRGIGWGAINIGGSTLVSRDAPPSKRAEVSGYYSVATNLAPTFAPAIALWLLGAVPGGFAVVFALSSLTALLAALASWQIPRAEDGGPRRVSAVDSPTVGSGEVAPSRTSPSSDVEASSAPESPVPATPRQSGLGAAFNVLIERRVLLAAALQACLTATSSTTGAFIPLYARSEGIEYIGWYFVASGVAVTVPRVFLGRFLDRGSRGQWVACGFALCAAGLVLLFFGGAELPAMIAGGAVYALGVAVVNPALMALAIDQGDPRRPGAAMATYLMSYQFGTALGAPGTALVIERFGFSAMFAAAFALICVGLVFTIAKWSALQPRPSRSA
ncbi:MAG: putative quinolone resistance protein [Chloroflexi bacterium]|nr:putative quinolone resistance protein [Chloroflexota bacterium]